VDLRRVRTPRSGLKGKLSAALGVFATVVLMLFLWVALPGCGGEAPSPLPRESENPSLMPAPGLSMNQGQVLEEYGYPDHFFISIDPYSGDRIETWIYYSRGKSLDFDNGELFGEEDIEDQSEEYPPTDLRPEDFESLMTPGEAEELLGEPLYTYDVEESLMAENTFIVFKKAVLLYRGDQLIGVDTQVKPPVIPYGDEGGGLLP